jgi:hypothetical protein
LLINSVHLLSVLAILTVITPYIALQIFDQFADGTGTW